MLLYALRQITQATIVDHNVVWYQGNRLVSELGYITVAIHLKKVHCATPLRTLGTYDEFLLLCAKCPKFFTQILSYNSLKKS